MKNITDLPDYKMAPLRVIRAADKLLKMKAKHNVWTVIKEVLKIWSELNPKQYKSHLVEVSDVKKSRKTTSVGSKHFSGISKAGGSYNAYLLDIPEKVIYMIRTIYSPEELPFDKKFYKEFARRFPAYKVMERI